MSGDLILTAATIITMDPAHPRVQAVGVSGGTIAAVGTVDECRAALPGAEERDLGAVALLPGFVEAHSHPFLSGVATEAPAYWIAPYVGYPTWDSVTALFTKLEKEQPAGQPLIFNGLDKLLHGCEEPDASVLDGYFPDRPVVVLDNSGHATYFNTALIAHLGWDTAPPADPVGGSFGRKADGSLSGVAKEVSAVMMSVQPMMAEVVKHPLYSAAQWYARMARAGITATSEMTYSDQYKQGYEALAQMPHCPLRVSLYHMSTDPTCGEKVTFSVPETMLRKQGIKLWADGSPWVGNIAVSFPYLDTPTTSKAGIEPGVRGESALNYSRTQLDEVLDKHASEGWQMAFHVNGDVGIDVVLDAYERALNDHGLVGTDHRWRMEHCGAGRGDQFARAAAMGAVASLGPFQFHYWGDLLDGQMFDSAVGSQWVRARDAFDAGVRPSFHNDGSVSPPLPLLNIECTVTRTTTSGAVHGENQAVTMHEALEAETVNAAHALHRDDLGSITVGKLADFVELSMDPFEADPRTFTTQVTVQGTWVGGERIDLDTFLGAVKAVDSAPHAHLAKVAHSC